MPTIGQLRHTITVQSNTASVDSNGWIQSDSWSAVGPSTQRAAIEPMSVNEPFIAGQNQPRAMYRITIRDDGSAYSSANRIIGTLHSTSRVWRIVGLRRLDEEMEHWIEFTAEEIEAQ